MLSQADLNQSVEGRVMVLCEYLGHNRDNGIDFSLINVILVPGHFQCKDAKKGVSINKSFSETQGTYW